MRPALSIVLPAYNEEGNIERVVRDAAAAAGELAPPYEIVVVDDGSRDRTREILAGLGAEMGARLRIVPHPVNLGYGAALRIHGSWRSTRYPRTASTSFMRGRMPASSRRSNWLSESV